MEFEIYTASKEQRLAWLIKRYSILDSDFIKCEKCGIKIKRFEKLKHYVDIHNAGNSTRF